MTYFIVMGAIIVISAGVSAFFFRKGGIYNPVETPKSELPIITPYPMQDYSQELYVLAKSLIGEHLTLDPHVPAEVGCAEAVSTILAKAGFAIPSGGIPSVVGLVDWMLKNDFQEEIQPSPGRIIVGRSPTDAHVGVCGENWVLSNTSFTGNNGLEAGIFQANYRYVAWLKVFPNTRYFSPTKAV